MLNQSSFSVVSNKNTLNQEERRKMRDGREKEGKGRDREEENLSRRADLRVKGVIYWPLLEPC